VIHRSNSLEKCPTPFTESLLITTNMGGIDIQDIVKLAS
jgi:hypothetical protein